MTSAEWIVEFLKSRGVERVYELSGGMITPLLDAALGRIDLIDMHHEQAAGFAAEAEARITGIPGIAMATSGPGATNLLTAIGSCYFDSTPCIFITGQVPTKEIKKRDSGQRQNGFQETDIIAMARPITKAAWQLTDVQDVVARLPMAWETALAGRPGPVLLDIPLDVLRAECAREIPAVQPVRSCSAPDVTSVLDALRRAERPLVLVGGGCAGVKVRDRVRSMLNRLNVPVVASLMGLDVTPLCLGMIGTYGNRWANKALMASDVLLVLGSRLDVRQTGSLTDRFMGKKIIQVDVDPGEFNRRIGVDRAITCDVGDFCDAVSVDRVCGAQNLAHRQWLYQIGTWINSWVDTTEQDPPGINPNKFMSELSYHSIQASSVCIDVGAHQMWAAQSFVVATRNDQRFLTSGGMGAMGWALPAAVGAALARHGQVLCIAGDAGFQVNIQELQTIARLDLPIKIVVLNNGGHGMVRQFQRELFGGRYAGTEPSSPNFVEIARGYGIVAVGTVSDPGEVVQSIQELWRVKGPALLEVMIDHSTEVVPKAKFGHGLDEMDPPR